jgi:HlyD family secretion protein
MKLVRIAVVVVIVAALALALRYTLFRQERVDVTVFRVAAGPVEETVTNSKAGTVETRMRATLSPEIGGRVVEIAVREGDTVSAGQLLLRMADDDYAAEVTLRERARTAAEAARREACLAADQAEREHARYVRLSNDEDEIVSEELLEQLASRRDVGVAACEAAKARVEEAEAARRRAKVELEKTVIRAPFDGVVAELTAELGEWITPSPPGLPIPPVIELLQREANYVSAPLDEADLARVAVGQPVHITLDAFPGQSFAGRVVRLAPYVLDLEEHSRTFEIEVEFEDPEFAVALVPGASADVEVVLDRRDDARRIPTYALMEGGRVLVLDGETLVERDVATGLRNWQFTEITDGLETGERVVVSLDRAEVQAGARVGEVTETLR